MSQRSNVLITGLAITCALLSASSLAHAQDDDDDVASDWLDAPPATKTERATKAPKAAKTDALRSEAKQAQDTRALSINGRAATARDLAILARFEHAWGVRVPAGAYWYDDASGAAGLWGGPTRGFLPAGLGLGGGRAPANASGGGHGRLTAVFINGRELHPLDVQGLTQMLGQAPIPGAWWVDSAGNFGLEGQGPIGNLLAIARQRQRGRGGSYYRSDVGTGSSVFVGSGCAAVSGRLGSSSSDSSYSYYVGCD